MDSLCGLNRQERPLLWYPYVFSDPVDAKWMGSMSRLGRAPALRRTSHQFFLLLGYLGDVSGRGRSDGGARRGARYCGILTLVFRSSTSLSAEMTVSFSRFFSLIANLLWSVSDQSEVLVFAS